MQIQDIEKSFTEIEKQAKSEQVEVELSGTLTESFSAGYTLGKLNKYSASTSHQGAIRVIADHSVGLATTESLDLESLKLCYQEAKQSALDLAKGADKSKPIDELLMPAEAKVLEGVFSDQIEKTPIELKIKWAQLLEAETMAASPLIKNVPYSGYGDSVSERFLFNSRGQRLSCKSGGAQAYSYAIAGDEKNKVSSSKDIFLRDLKDFNPTALAKATAENTLALVGARPPKTGKYTVLFENEVAGQLVDAIMGHFSAKTVAEEGSLLKGKIGTEFFSPLLTIVDDPLLAKLSGARPFDSEGVPSHRNTLVKNGRLETFLTNSKYAKIFGLKNTGNAQAGAGEMDISASNIVVEKGKASVEQLLASAEELIFITQFEGGMHAGYNGVTGDFSLPVSGFLYRGGKREMALNQFVVSGNVFDVLRNIKALSNRYPDTNDSMLVPDLLVENLSIAGE